jgi:hypothetical protein
MRAATYGPCWPNSCAICRWEVVRTSCGGQVLLVRVDFVSGRERGNIWFCSRSCLEVEELIYISYHGEQCI